MVKKIHLYNKFIKIKCIIKIISYFYKIIYFCPIILRKGRKYIMQYKNM